MIKEIFKLIYGRIVREIYWLDEHYRSLFCLPGMTRSEIKELKKIFLSLKGKKIKILEWGCGRSTVYYSKYLRSIESDFEWYGIDNSKEWHGQVKAMIKKNNLQERVRLFLFEFIPFWMKKEWNPGLEDYSVFRPIAMNEINYIEYPGSLGIKFDVIIVDARFRRRCLIKAKQMLNKGGFVVLHDAQKAHYQSPLSEYSNGRFIESGNLYSYGIKVRSKMWIGGTE